MSSTHKVLTKADTIRILYSIAARADAAPATASVARRMAQAFEGVPGVKMPTDAEIEALRPDADDDDE